MSYYAITADLTSGDATVYVPAGGVNANVSAGDMFHKVGVNVAYVVGSITDDTHFELSSPYAGLTESAASCQVTTSATPVLGLPYAEAGDTEQYAIVTEAMRRIEDLLTGSTEVPEILAGDITVSSLTASRAVFTDANKKLVSNAITGTGNVVMSASPTLTGTLSGANATFSGTLAAGATTITAANEHTQFRATNASSGYTSYYYNTSTLAGYVGNGSSILSGASSTEMIIRGEGGVALAYGNARGLTVGATGISVTGNITAGSGGTGATSAQLTLNAGSTSGWGPFIQLQRNSTAYGYVGLESQLIGNNNNNVVLYAASGLSVKSVINGSTVTTADSTGFAVTGNASASGVLSVGTTPNASYVMRTDSAAPLWGMMLSGTQTFSIGGLSGGGAAFYYGSGNTEGMRLTSSGLSVGGTAARSTTDPTNAINIYDGTAPVGTLTNGVTLYSTSGECRVMDAAGNATLLSPHDSDYQWIHHCVKGDGTEVLFRMELMANFLHDKYGADFLAAHGVPFAEQSRHHFTTDQVMDEAAHHPRLAAFLDEWMQGALNG